MITVNSVKCSFCSNGIKVELEKSSVVFVDSKGIMLITEEVTVTCGICNRNHDLPVGTSFSDDEFDRPRGGGDVINIGNVSKDSKIAVGRNASVRTTTTVVMGDGGVYVKGSNIGGNIITGNVVDDV